MVIKEKQTIVVNDVRHVDQQAADYRPTHGIDKDRRHASGILRAVDSGGYIEMDTLVELLELLGAKTDYR